MRHIRLPLKPEMVSPEFSSGEAIERSLRQLDRAVGDALGLGYAVLIDMHPGKAFVSRQLADPQAGLRILESAWELVGRRYAGTPPDRVFFEALNEPAIPSAIWNGQGAQLVAAIRRAAPDHTIVYGPAFYERIEALESLSPLPQDNIVYSFHFYDPMSFTHQGQTWGPQPVAKEPPIPFPSRLDDLSVHIDLARKAGEDRRADDLHDQFAQPWTSERIRAAISRASDWSVRNARPVVMDEFGVLSFKARPRDRASWIRAARTAAESFCIGWTHWEYADGFGFVTRHGSVETVDERMQRALLGPE